MMRLSAGLAGAAVAVVVLVQSVIGGFNPADEAWGLRVAQRLLAGDIPYRDVRIGMLPLAFLPMVWVGFVTGVHALVSKVLVALSVGASTFGVARVVQRFGGGRVATGLTAAAIAFIGMPALAAPYNPMAIGALAITMVATLALVDAIWEGDPVTGRAVLTGVCAGACVGIKLNIGLAATAVVAVVAVVTAAARKRIRIIPKLAGLATAGWSAVLAPMLVWIAASGAWRDFVFQLFDKGAYLDRGGIPLSDTLGIAARQFSADPLTALAGQAVVWLPLVAGPLFVAGMVLAQAAYRRDLLVVSAFLLAGLAMVFPRADRAHFTYLAPLLIGAAAIGVIVLKPPYRVLATMAGTAVVAVAVTLGIVRLGERWTATEWSSSPPLSSIRLTDSQRDAWVGPSALLGEAYEGRPLFVISPRASTVYLVSGAVNPTPFDYPIVTTLGSEGAEQIMNSLRRHEFEHVCVDTDWFGRTEPTELIDDVEAITTPLLDNDICAVRVTHS